MNAFSASCTLLVSLGTSYKTKGKRLHEMVTIWAGFEDLAVRAGASLPQGRVGIRKPHADGIAPQTIGAAVVFLARSIEAQGKVRERRDDGNQESSDDD